MALAVLIFSEGFDLAYHLFGQKGKDKIKIRFYLTIQNGSVIFQEKKDKKKEEE